MKTRRVWWWHCSECGDTMTQRGSYNEAEIDRDGHLKKCPARRAPWQLLISNTFIPDFS